VIAKLIGIDFDLVLPDVATDGGDFGNSLDRLQGIFHEKILLAHPREADWDELRAELRGSELAVRRYDTNYLKQALVRLVPELAKSGFNTEPAKVIPIYKSR
jgi:hypothetical protein